MSNQDFFEEQIMSHHTRYMGMDPHQIAEARRHMRPEAADRFKSIGRAWMGVLAVSLTLFGGMLAVGGQNAPHVGCVVTAEPGDTEHTLARRSHTNILDVHALNPQVNLGHIAAGEQINLTGCGDLGTDHKVTKE